jgi:hypothetical protein
MGDTLPAARVHRFCYVLGTCVLRKTLRLLPLLHCTRCTAQARSQSPLLTAPTKPLLPTNLLLRLTARRCRRWRWAPRGGRRGPWGRPPPGGRARGRGRGSADVGKPLWGQPGAWRRCRGCAGRQRPCRVRPAAPPPSRPTFSITSRPSSTCGGGRGGGRHEVTTGRRHAVPSEGMHGCPAVPAAPPRLPGGCAAHLAEHHVAACGGGGGHGWAGAGGRAKGCAGRPGRARGVVVKHARRASPALLTVQPGRGHGADEEPAAEEARRSKPYRIADHTDTGAGAHAPWPSKRPGPEQAKGPQPMHRSAVCAPRLPHWLPFVLGPALALRARTGARGTGGAVSTHCSTGAWLPHPHPHGPKRVPHTRSLHAR